MNIDNEFYTVLRQAGCSGQTAEDFEGIGYLVTVLYDGAVEEEWTVDNLWKARTQAEVLRTWAGIAPDNDGVEDQATWNGYEFIVSEVYIGPDTIEATGYMVDERY